ncbi:potassium transporter peripheral membrane component [Clostridium sp. C105KSO15]|nr:potassium transporter peripheral membrane component [Clostridium sp. C105KSO15]
MKKTILICGFHKECSPADSLIKRNYHVTVINSDYENCLALSETLFVIYGDGTMPFVLEDANAQNADIANALT